MAIRRNYWKFKKNPNQQKNRRLRLGDLAKPISSSYPKLNEGAIWMESPTINYSVWRVFMSFLSSWSGNWCPNMWLKHSSISKWFIKRDLAWIRFLYRQVYLIYLGFDLKTIQILTYMRLYVLVASMHFNCKQLVEVTNDCCPKRFCFRWVDCWVQVVDSFIWKELLSGFQPLEILETSAHQKACIIHGRPQHLDISKGLKDFFKIDSRIRL